MLSEQKIPVVEDFGVDLLAVETAPWDRLGVPAAFVNLKGQGDFISVTVAEIPARPRHRAAAPPVTRKSCTC